MSNIEILNFVELFFKISRAPFLALGIYAIHNIVKLSKNPFILKYSVFISALIGLILDVVILYFIPVTRK